MYIITIMKSIQITFDEKLLKELDETEEVRQEGRSAVLRRAVAQYLRNRRRWMISEKYRQAYGANRPTVDDELRGWEEEQVWPET
jgi:metal-responsive CopG/Arc/MetJ family transcriptional regulator